MGIKKLVSARSFIICDQRRKRSDGTAPIRLIVRFDGKEKVWGLNHYLTKTDFNQIRKKHITGNYSEERRNELNKIKLDIDKKEQEAADIINKLEVFSFEDFEMLLFKKDQSTLFGSLEAKIAALLRQDRAGNATTYQSTLNVMKLFLGAERKREGRKVTVIGGKDIPLTRVTVKFLNDFERWYLGQKKTDGRKYSATTVGIYIRNIRVILNDAISKGMIAPESMPIGRKRYRIPGSRKRKLALTLDEVAKILYVDLIPGSIQERCRDYWIFSYLTAGMNVTDIARLRYEDIDVEKITYIRAKTAYKKLEEPEFITIPMTPEIGRIIDKWGTHSPIPSGYVFPILRPGMSSMDERKAVMAATKSINTYIKKIAKSVGIEGNISTYTARHSFSTILKNSGVSVQAISEALGHSSTKVTESYLKDFEVEEKRKQFSNLMPKNHEDEL